MALQKQQPSDKDKPLQILRKLTGAMQKESVHMVRMRKRGNAAGQQGPAKSKDAHDRNVETVGSSAEANPLPGSAQRKKVAGPGLAKEPPDRSNGIPSCTAQASHERAPAATRH